MGTLVTLAWRGLQLVLWIVLLAFLLLVALSRFTAYEALVVRSGSMAPTITTGSVAIVNRAASSPAVGAIASFRNPDASLVTHRIVGMLRGEFVTRGDANNSNDPLPRPRSTVYGTVVASLPFVGYVIHTLEQPGAFLLLLLGSGGFLVLVALQTIYREVRRIGRGAELKDAD